MGSLGAEFFFWGREVLSCMKFSDSWILSMIISEVISSILLAE